MGEQEESTFLQTDCFSIRKHGLSSTAHWFQIMSIGDILPCYTVWLKRKMEKIGKGMECQCGVLCKSVENSWKNGGAWAEMGTVRLIESLYVKEFVPLFSFSFILDCNDTCTLQMKAVVVYRASGFMHGKCLYGKQCLFVSLSTLCLWN